jgi:hypothetical protein
MQNYRTFIPIGETTQIDGKLYQAIKNVNKDCALCVFERRDKNCFNFNCHWHARPDCESVHFVKVSPFLRPDIGSTVQYNGKTYVVVDGNDNPDKNPCKGCAFKAESTEKNPCNLYCTADDRWDGHDVIFVEMPAEKKGDTL